MAPFLSCWLCALLRECIFVFIFLEDGAGLPVGVRAVDPALASSQYASNDFIQAHSVEQRGVTRVDVELPTHSLLRKLKAHWEADQGYRMFLFSIQSVKIINYSQISLLKKKKKIVCFF